MEQELLLQVEDLHFGYERDRKALKGISLSIRRGEKIAVLGANGAGKSTLFLNLNGVLTPSKGRIIYRGTQIDKKRLNELRRHVGIVFQDADNQIIASSVLAEVSFGPMNLKLDRQEVKTRVEEALGYMNLTGFEDRPPHYLSGGEKKRVSIADILAMRPEVIIFDEPTASLDPYNADMLEEVLGKLAKEEKTILVSTHDVDFAYRWAERILVFCEGELIADGSPLRVFKQSDVLTRAHLKKPMLLEVYEKLLNAGLIPDKGAYPRQLEEFDAVLSSTILSQRCD